MHLAGWNFTVYENGVDNETMNVIDVQNPDFFQARETALQQYKPGSTLEGCRPLSEEELSPELMPHSFLKWIPINPTVIQTPQAEAISRNTEEAQAPHPKNRNFELLSQIGNWTTAFSKTFAMNSMRMTFEIAMCLAILVMATILLLDVRHFRAEARHQMRVVGL